MIRAGDHEVVVAGGMESMSNAPYILKKARFGYRLGDGTLIDLMTHDGLTSTFDKRHMVEQASFVSRELGISREDQDLWALRSHERAVEGAGRGAVPRRDRPRRRPRGRRGPAPRHVDREARRAEAGVRPRGDDDGRQRARCERRRGRARRDERGVREASAGSSRSRRSSSQAYVADEFAYLARTPAKAGAKALEKAGKTIGDVERVELNEAFSSVVLNSTKMLGADPEQRERQRRRRRARAIRSAPRAAGSSAR